MKTSRYWGALVYFIASSASAAPGLSDEQNSSQLEISESLPLEHDTVLAPEASPITARSLDEDGNALVYLNRCIGGCEVRRARNGDSRTNTSTVPDQALSIVSEFEHGDEAWDAVVACVEQKYEPYKVAFTEVDPGDTAHFEAIVAGTPADIGRADTDNRTRLLGLAPFYCGGVENAISFSFANTVSSIQTMCETVAHEMGHTFGLQHQYLCEDPMTYLQGCGEKWFQDSAESCGRADGPEDCTCGLSQQNTHQILLDRLGASDPSPPEVQLIRPLEGARVRPRFGVAASVVDNVKIDRVELWVNDSMISELTEPPFAFNGPSDVEGTLNVEIRAIDNRGDETRVAHEVVVTSSCSTDSACGASELCLDGFCATGPEIEGGLGSYCERNEGCHSGICALRGDSGACSVACDPEQDLCPEAFECAEAGDSGVCWPRSGSIANIPQDAAGSSGSSGGCQSASYRNSWFILALLGFLLFGFRSPRRAR